MRGALSSATTPDIVAKFIELFGRPAEGVTLHAAAHHVPLDSPAELNALLRERFGPDHGLAAGFEPVAVGA